MSDQNESTGETPAIEETEDDLLVDIENNIAALTLNRPGVGNALSSSLLDKLTDTLYELGSDKSVRCAILRGAGSKAFCVGIDLAEMLSATPPENYALISRGGRMGNALRAIDKFPYPIVAMIRGYAFGAGLEMALACDIRVASENSKLGMPPARLGIVYPPEGIARFLREVGPLTTKKLFLTARHFSATEGREMGLLDWVVPDEVVEDLTMDIAGDIMKRAPLSVVGLKKCISILSTSGPRAATEPEITRLVREAISSEDAHEGLAAFAEKRSPRFKGC
jgi:enoyl-CoA hydratase/carnithine racemase